MTEYIAAVLVRGTTNVTQDVKDALRALKLLKKHAYVVMEDTPAARGMMRKCKDYITYGPVTKETVTDLKKRGDGGLHPPRGGMGSIKKQYQQGGALGFRSERMDELVQRMI